MNTSRIVDLGRVVVFVALVATACAPSVPNLADISPEALPTVSTTSPPAAVMTSVPATTAGPTADASSSTTFPATSTTAVTTSTTLADTPVALTAGPWTLEGQTRDLSGTSFTATVTVPVFSADVDPALVGRINTRVDGQVESQIGSTLALWRSIEAQESRDIGGSTLRLEFDVAQFSEEFVSIRFFSDESTDESAAAKRQATTLMIDLTSGVVIGLEDVLVAVEGRATLLSLVLAGLLEEYYDGDTESFALWTGDLSVDDLDQVALTPGGLEVWFDELEVGPPDLGMPVVSIPYSSLTGLIDLAGLGGEAGA